jgi:hypothetical protein
VVAKVGSIQRIQFNNKILSKTSLHFNNGPGGSGATLDDKKLKAIQKFGQEQYQKRLRIQQSLRQKQRLSPPVRQPNIQGSVIAPLAVYLTANNHARRAKSQMRGNHKQQMNSTYSDFKNRKPFNMELTEKESVFSASNGFSIK